MNALGTSDDFDLCDRVFCELSTNSMDVDACGELEWVVRLVWDSSGLIGNGGFHRLFEGNYRGDPGFLYTVTAYKRIGAEAAYQALQAAFRQFPGGVLPAEIDERLRIFASLPQQIWDEIGARYYGADKETERCLARFIREHRSGYERLLADRQAEPGGPANASQPLGPHSTSTPSAAGSRR